MYRKRSAILVVSSLALAMLWHLSANSQEPSNAETANAKVRTLQRERVVVLQRAVELALAQYRAGTLDFRTVHAMQNDLLDAQLEMARTREERIGFLRSQLKAAKEWMAISEMRFESGQTSKLDTYQAKSAALLVMTVVSTTYCVQAQEVQIKNEDVDSTRGVDAKTLQGQVVDSTGKPVPAAMVWFRYGYDAVLGRYLVLEKQADNQGRFLFYVPAHSEPPKVVLDCLWAYAPHHGLGSLVGRWSASDDDASEARIELPASTGTTLHVVDADGIPIEGVLVVPWYYQTTRVTDVVPAKARKQLGDFSDAQGRVSLPSLDRRQLWKVQLRHPRYGLQVQRIIEANRSQEVPPIRLRPVCRIEGRITAKKAEWVQDVGITLTTDKLWEQGEKGRPPWPTVGMADVVTDAEGRFVVPEIAQGELRFSFHLDPTLPVRPEVPSRVKALSGKQNQFEIHLRQLVEMRCSVIAKDTGKPFPGLDIYVRYGTQGQHTDVTSDQKGEFKALVLPGRVGFQVMNLAGTNYLYLRELNREVRDDVRGTDVPRIELTPTKPQAGRLVDGQDRPLDGVRVYAVSGSWVCSSATADEDGQFTLPKFPLTKAPAAMDYVVTKGEAEWHTDRGELEVLPGEPLLIRKVE